MTEKRLRTVKRASAEIGVSEPYLWALMQRGKLTTYKVGRATYISLTEFESIAVPVRKSETV